MTKKTGGAHTRTRKVSAFLGVVGLVLMSAGLSLVVQGSASAAPTKVHKSYVCKYVDKPGVAERLKGGENPIWVDNHSLLGFNGTVTVGQQFKDAQFLSVVIVANTPRLNPEPTVADCPGVVTPDVLFTDSVCQDGTATAPAWVGSNTADINYAITSGSVANGQSVTITATPKAGFSFTATGNSVFTHTFGPAATGCEETPPPTLVTPSVTFHDAVCNSDGVTNPYWTGGNTADIVYTVTSGAVSNGSAVTITATPMAGFAFTSGAQTVFHHTFGPTPVDCVHTQGTPVTPTATTFQDPTCANSNVVAANLGGQGFLTAAQSQALGNFVDAGHVTYTITGSFAPGGTVNVAASPDTGYTLSVGSTSQWSHTFGLVVTCQGSHHVTPPPVTIPAVIHSGFGSVGMTSAGTNSGLYTWGYSLAGTGAAFFLTALVMGRRRQSVS